MSELASTLRDIFGNAKELFTRTAKAIKKILNLLRKANIIKSEEEE